MTKSNMEQKQVIKNRYLWHYVKFLKLEIPNFLQIVTLVGFLSVFLKNEKVFFLIPLFVSLLLFLYHINKFGEYINTQIKDSMSDLKAYNLNPAKYNFEKYIIITDVLFFIVIQLLAIALRPY